jgi:predicted HTH transcriptional regulator
MSIFGTALTQLTTVDLQGLLQEAAVENVRLEFKLLFPNKEDTLKKLSSFANTFGGFMVIGAKANSATGRIEDLPGINVEPGYKQKVVQWCFDAASPPITVQVLDPIPAPAGNAKVCYVVYVPASERLHIS